MPTPEHHAMNAVQLGGLIAALIAFIFSPVTWAGFIGAAFGVAFSEPKTYREGLLWLAFGLACSLAANAWLVVKIGNFANGLAFLVAFVVAKFHKTLFSQIDAIINRKGNQL